MPVPVTHPEHVRKGRLFKVRMQYERVLILLARVSRHVAYPCGESVFRYHVLLQVLLGLLLLGG